MRDVTCPYCDFGFDDNDFGENGSGTLYELRCPDCKKIMMAQYELWPSFDAYKAPCLNGGNHKFEEIKAGHSAFVKYKRRCKHCNYEIIIDKVKHEKEIKIYFEENEKQIKLYNIKMKREKNNE